MEYCAQIFPNFCKKNKTYSNSDRGLSVWIKCYKFYCYAMFNINGHVCNLNMCL